jgi:hypothetical protein
MFRGKTIRSQTLYSGEESSHHSGVAPSTPGMSLPFSQTGVCVQTQPSAPKLFFMGAGPSINGQRCLVSGLVGSPGLYRPPECADTTDPSQIVSDNELSHPVGSAPLTTPDVVQSSARSPCLRACPTYHKTRLTVRIGSQRRVPRRTVQGLKADPLLRQAF